VTYPVPVSKQSLQEESNSLRFKLHRNSDGKLDIQAIAIPMGMILDSMASASDFQYVCSQQLADLEVSINCKDISTDQLLAALKLALKLSVKISGKIVTISPTKGTFDGIQWR
jgi:hypothetical protein